MVQQIVEIGIREMGGYVVSLVADSLRNSVKPPAPIRPGESPLGATTEHNAGCPVCAVHREAAEASALVTGLAERAGAAGEIPAGLGGTVPLARKCLEDARGGLADVAVSFPGLRSEIETAERALRAASTALDGTQDAGTIQIAAVRLREAWAACYALADAAFKPAVPAAPAAPAAKHDGLIDWIDEVQRHPEMTHDEAIAKLKAVLDGRTDGRGAAESHPPGGGA